MFKWQNFVHSCHTEKEYKESEQRERERERERAREREREKTDKKKMSVRLTILKFLAIFKFKPTHRTT